MKAKYAIAAIALGAAGFMAKKWLDKEVEKSREIYGDDYSIKDTLLDKLENGLWKSYDALEKTLKLVNIQYKGKKIACPFLGTSRFDGNGDRDKVMEIFNKTMTDVNLTIFDYFQKSRDEEIKEMWTREKAVKKYDYKAYYKIVKERKKQAEERFKKNGHRRY